MIKKRPVNGKKRTLPTLPDTAQKLTGIGSNAWFDLDVKSQLPANHFRIKRYNDLHELDFDGVYFSNKLDIDIPFQFTYDSNCEYCHIIQAGTKIRLGMVSTFYKI